MSLIHVLLKGNKSYRKEVRRKVVVGTTIGIALGAVAGMLWAPKAGKEIRTDLVKTAQEFPETIRQVSENARNKVEEMKEKIMEKKAAIAEDPTFKKIAEIAKEKVQSFAEKDEITKVISELDKENKAL